jgi:DNA polymerase/3'-5' exonuclease PolX
MNRKIAETFYLEVRELQLSNKGNFKEWAYRKAAWSLDHLKENIDTIFKKKGLQGLLEIPCIGESLAKQIESFLKEGNRNHLK